MEARTIAILIAALVMRGPSLAAQEAVEQQAIPKGDARDHVLHPWALNEFIDQLGGRRVTLLKSRVIAVLNPRVFLIETAGLLAPLPRHHARVAVFVDNGELRIERELLVDSNVRVIGVARTLVGMQMTREVPWPPELTREVLKRYDIGAAVLATSVQTADGVELTAK